MLKSLFLKNRKTKTGQFHNSIYNGHVDRIYQSDIAGWCIDPNGLPCEVNLILNDKFLTSVRPNISRADLAFVGICANAGFAYNFPEPLSQSDELIVQFPDGTPLPGSKILTYRERLRRLLTDINPQNMKGIEIGALDRPILSKKKADILFVDHASTDALKEKYGDRPRSALDLDSIVNVDIVWSGESINQLFPADMKLDYCLASHVIEHVADPIGWLCELSAILRPGGIISLAIPERSRTFDHRRAVSQPSDLIGAFIERRSRPTAKQIFDCEAFMSDLGSAQIVDNFNTEKIKSAFDHAKEAQSSRSYVDVHCNVFTVASFLECWSTIKALDILSFDVAKIFDVQENTDEFIVILKKN